MTFEKQIVIDAKGHLLGRLASIVAKELLKGQKIVVVRCEELAISGPFFRNKLRFQRYFHKATVFNPARGPFHFRAPSRMFYHVVRGMVPHKTARGTAAMDRLKVFDGIPAPYDKIKRNVVPEALRVLRLKPGRKYTALKRVSSEFGWKYQDVVEKLEAKRKVKAQAYYEKKKAVLNLKAKAAQNAEASLKAVNETIANSGY
ncbi:ribosomal protein L13 [Piromyces finnis]|uniref:Ribosomal protein L13 n=1 Tax=Piromyces finnis TaxID=1754191 RepID=A0A1Y1VDJ1_9FUNG|nr:ribosomal protein L13 [Piromyces finnis]|eukprot:ORX53401.1 ribosomal protein L13 [Piromyces finnis]